MFHLPTLNLLNYPTPNQYRKAITFKIQKRKGKLLALAHICSLKFLLSKGKDRYHEEEIENRRVRCARFFRIYGIRSNFCINIWVTIAVPGYFCQRVICSSKKLTLVPTYSPIEWQIKDKFVPNHPHGAWEQKSSAPDRRPTVAKALNVESGNQVSNWDSTEWQLQAETKLVFSVWNSLRREFKKLEHGLQGFEMLLLTREIKQVWDVAVRHLRSVSSGNELPTLWNKSLYLQHSKGL